MSEKQALHEFIKTEGEHSQANSSPDKNSSGAEQDNKENRLLMIWENLSRAGLGEIVFRLGTHLFSIAAILVVIWVMRAFYLSAQQESISTPRQAALAAALPSPTPTEKPPDLPVFSNIGQSFMEGIPRLVVMHTDLPTHPRNGVITYTVQTGDTIFGIAEKYNLKPQTILWGNYYTLADVPDRLQPGQVLNILPMDGTYHKWSAGEGLNGVAKGYNVKPEDIINYAGNHLDPNTIGNLSHPNIAPGTMLVVPGGHRAFVSWSAPFIGRQDPAQAKILGPGFCGTIVDGVIGTGSFVWPANAHYLSGYDYSPETNHPAIDIAGHLGDPIYAADNGVIVYAGWNNWGYGNVVVIDHGNGWQTLYGHQSVIAVGCGQSVMQGSIIGYFGSTGNSSGPHLHFEMSNETYGKVNPHNFLPAP